MQGFRTAVGHVHITDIRAVRRLRVAAVRLRNEDIRAQGVVDVGPYEIGLARFVEGDRELRIVARGQDLAVVDGKPARAARIRVEDIAVDAGDDAKPPASSVFAIVSGT
jgi:hypothetical protein